MKKTLVTMMITFGGIANGAPSNDELRSRCENEYGSFWASSRVSYCSAVPLNQYLTKEERAEISEKDLQARLSLLANLRAQLTVEVDRKLAEAKANGMTCAKRERLDGTPFVMCKDDVGSFVLK